MSCRIAEWEAPGARPFTRTTSKLGGRKWSELLMLHLLYCHKYTYADSKLFPWQFWLRRFVWVGSPPGVSYLPTMQYCQIPNTCSLCNVLSERLLNSLLLSPSQRFATAGTWHTFAEWMHGEMGPPKGPPSSSFLQAQLLFVDYQCHISVLTSPDS